MLVRLGSGGYTTLLCALLECLEFCSSGLRFHFVNPKFTQPCSLLFLSSFISSREFLEVLDHAFFFLLFDDGIVNRCGQVLCQRSGIGGRGERSDE